jgi:hypothetical protein
VQFTQQNGQEENRLFAANPRDFRRAQTLRHALDPDASIEDRAQGSRGDSS